MLLATTAATTVAALVAIGSASAQTTPVAEPAPENATSAVVAAASSGQFSQSLLTGRAVLPGATYRPGSAPSGAFFSATDRTNATGNGVALAAAPAPALAGQPVQGFSAVIPAAGGDWWALTDNGFGARANSADSELWVQKVKVSMTASTPASSVPGSVSVIGGFGLSDPNGYIPWRIVCDPRTGTALPDFDFNKLPTTTPAACGSSSQRRLTGFDFDPESMQIGSDGTFWIGEEFGPFLLHVNSKGVLLETPIPLPGVASPQNPTLDLAKGDQPNLNASRGFEGMGISPDRSKLYPMTEGPLTADDQRDLRVYEFDTKTRAYTGAFWKVRLELRGAKVNLTTLRKGDGSLAYPTAVAPPAGFNAIGELTMINDRQAILIERDNGGDSPNVPRFKKLFLLTFDTAAKGSYATKSMLVDLLAIPDPDNIGGEATASFSGYFRMPYITIESVFPINDRTLLVANDNNFPFSNGRAFSRGGALAPDDNEFVTIGLDQTLALDGRVNVVPAPVDPAVPTSCVESFESRLGGWGAWWSGNAARSTTFAATGSSSLELTGNPASARSFAELGSCVPAKGVTFSMRTSSGTAAVYLKLINAAGTTRLAGPYTATTSWKTVTVDMALTVNAFLGIEAQPAAGASVFIDDIGTVATSATDTQKYTVALIGDDNYGCDVNVASLTGFVQGTTVPKCAGPLADDQPAATGIQVPGRQKMNAMAVSVNAAKVAFTVHDGDTKSGSTECRDSTLDATKAVFNGLPYNGQPNPGFDAPLVYTPGDNEWTDCHRYLATQNKPVAEQMASPIQNLATIRSKFFAAPVSQGKTTMSLTRQSAEYPENVRWQQGPVVYLTLNMPGSNNNFCSPRQNTTVCDQNGEATKRNAANLAWLRDTFDVAKERDAKAVIVVAQANPNFERDASADLPTYDLNGYDLFLSTMRDLTKSFAGQVVYVHGDSHSALFDKPALLGTKLANFTRIETAGKEDTHWVKLTVDPTGPTLLSFELVLVQANLGNNPNGLPWNVVQLPTRMDVPRLS